MDRTDLLLTSLAEESVEVAQRVTKALRFGLDDIQPGQQKTNRERIMEEVHDLRGVLRKLGEEGVLDVGCDIEAEDRKGRRVEEFDGFLDRCNAIRAERDRREQARRAEAHKLAAACFRTFLVVLAVIAVCATASKTLSAADDAAQHSPVPPQENP